MNCPKCKKKLRDNVNFCGYCGYRFKDNIDKHNMHKEETNYNDVYTGGTVSSVNEVSTQVESLRAMNTYLKQQLNQTPTSQDKDASVVGRGIVGGLVAGPAGAVVGALSAIDKNNKKKK